MVEAMRMASSWVRYPRIPIDVASCWLVCRATNRCPTRLCTRAQLNKVASRTSETTMKYSSSPEISGANPLTAYSGMPVSAPTRPHCWATVGMASAANSETRAR